MRTAGTDQEQDDDDEKPAKSKKPPKFWRDIDAYTATQVEDDSHRFVQRGLVPGPESPICAKCKLDKDGCARNPYVGPAGADNPIITVVFESVSRAEDAAGGTLIATGSRNATVKRNIDAIAKEVGFDATRVRYISLTRCANLNKKQIDYKPRGNWCRTHLVDDLWRHQPQLIIPVGTTVLGRLSHKSNVQDWAGMLLTYRGWPDDWITDKRYDAGSPFTGPRPVGRDDHIPMLPIQSPYLVWAAQNPVEIKRWKKHIRIALELARDGVTAKNYDRPWFKLATTPDEIISELNSIPSGTVIAYDLETKGLLAFAPTAGIVFLMFRWKDPDGMPRALGFPWLFDGSPVTPEMAKQISPVILAALYRSKIRGHNVSFDLVYTAAQLPGTDIVKLASALDGDTRYMLYALKQTKESLGLERVAYNWCPDMAGYEEDFELLKRREPELLDPAEKKGGHYAATPRELWASHLKPYVMGDVEVAYNTAEAVEEQLLSARRYKIPLADPNRLGHFREFEPPGRHFMYRKFMLPAQRVLACVMARGMHVDPTELAYQETIFPKLIKEAREKLRSVDPRVLEWCQQNAATVPEWVLDLESRDQLRTILFNILGMPVKRLTKSGQKIYGEDLTDVPPADLIAYAAIDKFTLNGLVAENPSLAPLKDYRKLHKAYTAFVRSMRNIKTDGIDKHERKKDPYLQADGRVHATFNQAGTRSGRLGCCIPVDEIVHTDRGAVRIGFVRVGDRIQTASGPRAVTTIWARTVKTVVALKLSNGRTVRQSEEHKVLAYNSDRMQKQWTQAGQLVPGDKVYLAYRKAPGQTAWSESLVKRVLGCDIWEAKFKPVFDVQTYEIENMLDALDRLGFEASTVPARNGQWTRLIPSVVGKRSFCKKRGVELVEVKVEETSRVDGVECVDIEVEGVHEFLHKSLVTSNSNPNLQQLPRDSLIKRMYTSRFGVRGCIYQADLSQIELRLLAAACGDPLMVKAYRDNIDLHSLTTSRVFNIPYERFEKSYMAGLQKLGRDKEAKDLNTKRSIGKCVDPSTLISINGRTIRIGSLAPTSVMPDTFYDLEGKCVETGYCDPVRVVSYYNNGSNKKLLIVSRYGMIACSENHKFVLSDGRHVRAADLKQGDDLCPIKPLECTSEKVEVPISPFLCGTPSRGEFVAKLTPDLAYAVGVFVGDGCANANSASVCFGSGGKYDEWQDSVADVFNRIGFKTKLSRSVDKRCGASVGRLYLGSRHTLEILQQLGLVDADFKKTLCVPDYIFNVCDDVKRSFIAGLADTDGAVSKDGALSICSKRWQLIQDVIVLMRSIGIAASTEADWNKTYSKWYYSVNVAMRSSVIFKDAMRCKWKVERLREPETNYTLNTANPVKRIIDLGVSELCDIEMEKESDHLYLANGFLTHNTTNFLTGYGGGAYGLQTTLAEVGVFLPLTECERIVDALFDTYPCLRTHIGKYKRFIMNNACAVSITGRVRMFEEVYSSDAGFVNKALRSGVNHLIQSTASDLMLLCMSVIEWLMREAGLESVLVSTVHDSIVVDAVRAELPIVHEICDSVINNMPEIIRTMMGDGYDASWLDVVPISGDAELGINYLDARKVVSDPLSGAVDWDALLADNPAAV